jgi:predicted nucleotidyltransferase
VRLDTEKVPRIVRAVHDAFGANANVWLFGSRTDDTKRGGDIDLYIETDLDRDIVARRSALLVQLADILGDQKIDLTVRPRSRPPHPLHLIAAASGILLSE